MYVKNRVVKYQYGQIYKPVLKIKNCTKPSSKLPVVHHTIISCKLASKLQQYEDTRTCLLSSECCFFCSNSPHNQDDLFMPSESLAKLLTSPTMQNF